MTYCGGSGGIASRPSSIILNRPGVSGDSEPWEGWGQCLGTRRRGIRLSLDAPGLLGGSDGECSCDKQGWDCLRF